MFQKKLVTFLGLGSILVIGCCAVLLNQKETMKPVFKEEVPLLKMTHEEKVEKVTAIRPFKVEAKKVMEYYDGQKHDVDSITKFEGVYRSNQGIDYTFQDEAFDVIASLDGVVSEVKDDPIFGKSITIQSDQIKITYQSLSSVEVQLNQNVKQNDIIGKAGESIYHKELGNHLHYVVSVSDKIIDPESIYEKTKEEIVK